MSSSPAKAWRCELCGYIHEGPEPPAECPVCGAPASDFSLCEDAPAATASGPAANDGRARRIVIVGGGVAGVSAAEAARQTSPESDIALISAEPGLPYYRLNLTRLLAGEIGWDDLPLHPADWYDRQRIRLLAGAAATAIATDRKEVEVSSGERLPYDKLILASGARAFRPAWPGAERRNVIAIRTADNVRQALDLARPGARCVCIGGGILGLETAGALARRGVRVDLLENSGWLMPRQLTREAGRILRRHVEKLGIRLHPNSCTRDIAGDDMATGVRLDNGDVHPADLVLVTTGIRPRNELAAAAGLAIRQGVIVDDHLATSNPDVLAAGDGAEHRGVLYGLWTAAQYQGTLAGMNAAGKPAAFGGLPRSNALKVLGLHVFSIGRFESEPGDTVVEQADDERLERYVFREGRLVGANRVGVDRQDAVLKKAVEEGRDFTALLNKGPTVEDVNAHL